MINREMYRKYQAARCCEKRRKVMREYDSCEIINI